MNTSLYNTYCKWLSVVNCVCEKAFLCNFHMGASFACNLRTSVLYIFLCPSLAFLLISSLF